MNNKQMRVVAGSKDSCGIFFGNLEYYSGLSSNTCLLIFNRELVMRQLLSMPI